MISACEQLHDQIRLVKGRLRIELEADWNNYIVAVGLANGPDRMRGEHWFRKALVMEGRMRQRLTEMV